MHSLLYIYVFLINRLGNIFTYMQARVQDLVQGGGISFKNNTFWIFHFIRSVFILFTLFTKFGRFSVISFFHLTQCYIYSLYFLRGSRTFLYRNIVFVYKIIYSLAPHPSHFVSSTPISIYSVEVIFSLKNSMPIQCNIRLVFSMKIR